MLSLRSQGFATVGAGAVLVLLLSHHSLGYTDAEAVAYYSYFTSYAYFTPLPQCA
jgi:hypothetical protein